MIKNPNLAELIKKLRGAFVGCNATILYFGKSLTFLVELINITYSGRTVNTINNDLV